MILCLRVALNGHHDLSGSPSYPIYVTIGNLGDLTIMGELSKVAVLFHRYYAKYHLRPASINGQDLPAVSPMFEHLGELDPGHFGSRLYLDFWPRS